MTTSPLRATAADLRGLNDWLDRQRAGQVELESFLEGLFGELEQMHAGLQGAEANLREQRLHVSTAQAELDQERELAHESESETVAELQARLHQIEQERNELESELEQVRNRAAEMAETMAQQKQSMNEQRAEWTEELRQLRRILDKQSKWLNEHPDGAGRGSRGAEPVAAAAVATSADPVVDSVMSQFESLQKDVARRRAQSKAGGKS